MSDVHCSSEALACADRTLWQDVLNGGRLLDNDSESAAHPRVWRWRLRFYVRQPRSVQVHVRGGRLERQVRGLQVVQGCAHAVLHRLTARKRLKLPFAGRGGHARKQLLVHQGDGLLGAAGILRIHESGDQALLRNCGSDPTWDLAPKEASRCCVP